MESEPQDLTRLARLLSSWVRLPLPLQHRDYSCTLPHLGFTWVLGN